MILSNHISTLRKCSRQKTTVSFTGIPCFASVPLICLNPGLISNFVQGTRKTSKTTFLLRPNSAQDQIYTQERTGKSRLLPGGPCSSEGSSARTYIPHLHTFLSFTSFNFKFIIQEKLDPRTESRNFILRFSLTSPR